MEKLVNFINDHGEKLTGTLHLPARSADQGIILAHCFTCSRHTNILRQLGQAFAEKGLIALRFDFSGNGQSEGIFSQSTFTKQTSELASAYTLLSDQGIKQIGLAGHSMGSVIALLAVSKINAVKAVCTIAGRLSGDRPGQFFTQDQAKSLEQTGQVEFISRGRSLILTDDFFADAAQYNIPQTISQLKIPLFIVHGDKDEIITADEAHTAHRLNKKNSQLAIIEGADHMFSQKNLRTNAVEKIVSWFLNIMTATEKNDDRHPKG